MSGRDVVGPGAGSGEWDQINRVMANEVRRWVVLALSRAPLCATDLVVLLGVDRCAMSKYLKPLKELGLIRESSEKVRKPLSLTSMVRVARHSTNVVISVSSRGGCRTEYEFRVTESMVAKFDRFARIHSFERVDVLQ